uniref:Uncharacterized protein n=1 Tax=Avena sativa TaxID=4498 RepID=A0ACD6ASB8_AVESA
MPRATATRENTPPRDEEGPAAAVLYRTSHNGTSGYGRREGQGGEGLQLAIDPVIEIICIIFSMFHATAEVKRQLLAAGFELLSENDDWDLQPGGRYFFTRNMSCLVAFAVGEKYRVGNGFNIIAAHTDSPCLKLKPRSASFKSGHQMINVQTYGGGLWHTWFDRDLTLAGRVILKAADGSFVHKLVKASRPLIRVPTLAIHLDRTVNSDGFKPNLENHLAPLLATKYEDTTGNSDDKKGSSSTKIAHHPLLLQILSEEIGCGTDEIIGMELNVCDTQPSCLGGGNNEFIYSGRLDNLASCYCALRSIVDSSKMSELSNEKAIRMVALFDNEEVGSDSMQGAGAPTMFHAMRRIVDSLMHQSMGEGALERAITSSFLATSPTRTEQPDAALNSGDVSQGPGFDGSVSAGTFSNNEADLVASGFSASSASGNENLSSRVSVSGVKYSASVKENLRVQRLGVLGSERKNLSGRALDESWRPRRRSCRIRGLRVRVLRAPM